MAVKQKNSKRAIILKVHKVLGLATGLVLFIVALTGCLWVFKAEIEGFYDTYKYVRPQNRAYISASVVKAKAEMILSDKTIHGVIYGQPNEAIEVVFYQATPEVFYQSVFLNPYTGAFIKRVDHNSGFFAFVLKGHLRLWLPEAIGSRVVAYAVLLFLVILVSGFILWWPRNKKNWKQRLKFDWKATTRWKRKNFDVHTVIGFYVSAFALILGFTGCVMAFNWFYFITYKAAGGDKAPQFIMPKSAQAYTSTSQFGPIYDKLIPKLYKTYPEAATYELHYPENDTTAILVEVSQSKGLYYNMDYLFFDQNTLEAVETPSIYGRYRDAGIADKVIRMNYDIHIGAIGGIIGKIIAFLASFLCASMPVTGVLIWYGRHYKRQKRVENI